MDKLIAVADAVGIGGRETQGLNLGTSPEKAVDPGPRRIAFRSSGRRHGPMARLVSPSDVGELIKPFVFLARSSRAGSNG